VGTVRGKTIVQGIVPDDVTRVVFSFPDGSERAVSLNEEHAYSESFASEPTGIVQYSGATVVLQNAFGRSGTQGSYFG
jgi:hypothetical protein